MTALASPTSSSTSPTQQRSLFRNSNEDRKKREEETLRQMDEVTTKYMNKMEANSRFFVDASSETSVGIVVPRFEANELVLETTIGMGEFGVVLKVGTIVLNNSNENVNLRQTDTAATVTSNTPALWLSTNDTRIENVETDRILREELAKSCRRRQSNESNGTTSSTTASSLETMDYGDSIQSSSPQTSSTTIELAPVSGNNLPENSLLVIKQIRKDLYPKKRIEAAKDLAREAKFLARLQQLQYCSDDPCHQSSASSASSSYSKDQQRHHPYHHHTNAAKRNHNHPNIIALRGIVSHPGTPHFGILLDRLHLTLAELSSTWRKRKDLILRTLATTRSRKHRVLSTTLLSMAGIQPDQFVENVVGVTQKVGGWFKEQTNNLNNNNNNSNSNNNSNHSASMTTRKSSEKFRLGEEAAGGRTRRASPEALLLLGERILALWDVAEGMSHLHHHKILFRDLKTENVGRTVRSRVEGDDGRSPLLQSFDHREQQRMQIFDFGLAKECKPSEKVSTQIGDHPTSNSQTPESFYDTYQMTGMTGTMRIMAPEVIKCDPYGLPADVYSFGICMWEVFTGTKCNFLSAAEICDTKHTVRPKLPMAFDTTTEEGCVGMPRRLQRLMQKCWHEDPQKRPDFREISKVLRSELAELHPQSSNPDDLQQHQQQRFDWRKPSLLQQNIPRPLPFLSKGIADGKKYMGSPWRSCVNGNASGFWNKISKPQMRKQPPQDLLHPSGLDAAATPADLLSDQAGFWSRLEAIRASGLLDD